MELNNGQVPGLLMGCVGRKKGICWQSIPPSGKCTILGNVCGSLKVGWSKLLHEFGGSISGGQKSRQCKAGTALKPETTMIDGEGCLAPRQIILFKGDVGDSGDNGPQ